MIIRLRNLYNHMRASFWFIPILMCLGSVLLAAIAIQVDLRGGDWKVAWWLQWAIYDGGTETSRTLLSTLAGSMITVSGVTFSITVVALSLASSQFGPRLLVHFMRDTGNQVVLGAFVATFLYCLLVLGSISDSVAERHTASVSIAVVLSLMSIWVLIYFFHHVSASMRAENIVNVVACDVSAAIDSFMHKGNQGEAPAELDYSKLPDLDQSVRANCSGYLQAVDEEALCQLATEEDAVIKLLFRPGHFIAAGETLAEFTASTDISEPIHKHLVLGRTRTDEQDPEYGIHQLVEVAVRSLSPGINDPFTAISCIDWLYSVLLQLLGGPVPPAFRCDAEDRPRVILNAISFEGIVDSAFDQIRQNASKTPAVAIRLMAALKKLLAASTDPKRANAFIRQANLLHQGCIDAGMQDSDLADLESHYKGLSSTGQA